MLPLSCTSAPPPTLGPNLSPPFVLPPPPHWKQSLLSPNLFLLNAHFLPREHGRTIELWDRLPSTDDPGICYRLHLHSSPPISFLFVFVTQESDCVCRIFSSKLSICNSQISGIAPRCVITGNQLRCFIKSILVTDVRHLPRINLFTAPKSSSLPSLSSSSSSSNLSKLMPSTLPILLF